MRTHKATYTLPEEVLHDLNTFVEQRQRSRFVAEAIRTAIVIKKKELEAAYKAAASDKKRIRDIQEWSSTELEGWDD